MSQSETFQNLSGHVTCHRDPGEGANVLNKIKHGLCVCSYLLLIYLNVVLVVRKTENASLVSPSETYGLAGCLILYSLRLLPLCPLLFCVFTFLGVVCLNTFPGKPRLQHPPLACAFLCFRVVTRGQYPTLVRENVETNLSTCSRVGLEKFVFEVVTDSPLFLPCMERVREVVVPPGYRPRHGSLFKARALQYCLEPGVDVLSEDDWIVHLDEETLLTDDAVVGIVNFVCRPGGPPFGQGVVTYSKIRIVNWLTTLGDSARVGSDHGVIRFTLQVLQRPVFGWKGSFVVARASAERSVSYDHGPEGSVAEDCYFAMVASARGYRFGFVEGEMLEQSAFTLRDFLRQRQRWARGILLTACSSKIPFPYRLGPLLMSASAMMVPVAVLSMPLSVWCPVPVWPALNAACGFISSTFLYLYVLGTLKSFSACRYGVWRCGLLVLATVLASAVALLLETAAILLAFLAPCKQEFFVVQKDQRAKAVDV